MKIHIGEDEQNRYKNLLEIINEHYYYGYTAACGGNGTCGKCKVMVEKNNVQPLTGVEKSHLTEKEVRENVRLACQLTPVQGMIISLEQMESLDYFIESQYEIKEETELEGKRVIEGSKGYGIAVDVGTTTIVMALLDYHNRKVMGLEKTLNSQARYGADVISRIDKSQELGIDKLEIAVKEDILQCMEKLLDKCSVDGKLLERIVLAGNTTMLHFLMGFNPISLAMSPFKPLTTEKCEFSYDKFFDIVPHRKAIENCKIEILPSLSAYIGADILSGIYNSRMHEKEAIAMLIDIGTNGELVIGNRRRMLCTSTAAGPAFEGGHIAHGIGSVKGAIYQVEIDGKNVKTFTIGNEELKGICGTGIMDAVSELLRKGWLSEEGIMVDALDGKLVLDEKSQIAIVQRDIQEIQLAKSAIRAGIEVLIHQYGTEKNKIERVFLAGGFGSHLNISNVIHMGLLPAEFMGKIEVLGNSSLGGTIEYLLNRSADFEKIKGICSYVDLANVAEFNLLFIEHLEFMKNTK
ncbi:MAG: ASKHA domain-containing protein [Peptostreptococcales bacterium]|jgi:uncharacterized 2Fe-2S/4Fe-4S cluster protein (DUF4445 family)